MAAAGRVRVLDVDHHLDRAKEPTAAVESARSRCSVMRVLWRERAVTAQRLTVTTDLWALPNPKA
jgi:hypothetical protein